MHTFFLPLADVAAVAEAAPAGTNWDGFIGCFHPLFLHLPIGLIAGVIFLEVAALWRAHHHGKRAGKVEWFEESRPYVGIAAWLLAASGVAAALTGYLWRLDEFEPPKEALHDHQVLGFVVAGGCVVIAVLHALAVRFKSRVLLWAYRGVLVVTAGLLGPVGHLGGQLVHGDTFLSKNAPAWLPQPIKDLLGKKKEEDKSGKDESAYALVAKPILDARCISCHGQEKKKGQLQLDTIAGILKGGANGPVIVAGKSADSVLMHTLHAPIDDEEHMPPKAKPQPTAAEVAALAWWIDSGAKADGKFDPASAPAQVAQALKGLPATEVAGRAPVVAGPDAPAVDAAAVAALRAKQIAVQPLAQGSNLLWISFSAPAKTIKDADLGLLAPLGANIAQLDLARTQVTDAGLDILAKLPKLEMLDLRATGVTDAGIEKMAQAKALTSLNLTATGVTDAGVEKLATLPVLSKIYLWNSKVTDAGVAKLAAALPKAHIDIGKTPDAAVVEDPSKPVNAVCPVTGAAVNAAITTSFGGKTIGFANAEAKAKFEAAFSGQAKPEPAAAKKISNTLCPVSGKPVDPAAPTVEFEGKAIGFCCGNCPKAFQANPAKYKAAIK